MGTIKDRNGKELTEVEEIKKRRQEHTELYKKKKKLLMIWITTVAWSLTYSQTSWSVKSSGPKEVSLQTKLVKVMKFQLSYFKS